MLIHELFEGKTNKAEAPKPRNFVAKNAINTGAGAHKDKKKAAKQGDVKHKAKAIAESEQSVSEGSAHGYNVVRWYRKNRNSSKITAWLKKEAGLPKETKLYFDDADLVLGSDTIVPEALVDDTLKFNDLLTALVKVTGGASKEKVDGVYRSQEVEESATAGATSAANVGIGVAYKNKTGKTYKNSNGTVKNAADVKGANLISGGSIAKR